MGVAPTQPVVSMACRNSVDANEAPLLTFVIPVRNDARGLARCLASIARNSGRVSFEVVVADNGSTDGSATVASDAGARVLSLPGLRVAALRNRAAALARGVLLAFVDADHELVPTWTLAAAEYRDAHGIGAVGAPYSAPAAGTWVQNMYDALRDHRPGIRDARWLGSGNLLVHRLSFLEVSGFDETLETCEDVDLCQRLRKRRYRVLSDARLGSTHHGDPRTLRELFVSEMWRGRNNIRVTFRAGLDWRALPSVLIPLLDVALIGTLIVAVLPRARAGLMIGGPALLLMLSLSALRAARILLALSKPRPLDLLHTFAVAFVYDLGRAISLVVPVPHRRRSPMSHDLS
jgi:glycosyltransferase involved in cell wall biosynthesis